jgi:hypothetical protein
MAPIILDDHPFSLSLYPFAETRSVAEIRVGILTIRQKWELSTGMKMQTSAEAGISQLSPSENLVPANLVPSNEWMTAYHAGGASLESVVDPELVNTLNFPWDIFRLNHWAIRQDYQAITKGRESEAIPTTVQVVNPGNIFIEPGASLQFCTLNASTGPIYIGRNAEIMEGSSIRGPCGLWVN